MQIIIYVNVHAGVIALINQMKLTYPMTKYCQYQILYCQ